MVDDINTNEASKTPLEQVKHHRLATFKLVLTLVALSALFAPLFTPENGKVSFAVTFTVMTAVLTLVASVARTFFRQHIGRFDHVTHELKERFDLTVISKILERRHKEAAMSGELAGRQLEISIRSTQRGKKVNGGAKISLSCDPLPLDFVLQARSQGVNQSFDTHGQTLKEVVEPITTLDGQFERHIRLEPSGDVRGRMNSKIRSLVFELLYRRASSLTVQPEGRIELVYRQHSMQADELETMTRALLSLAEHLERQPKAVDAALLLAYQAETDAVAANTHLGALKRDFPNSEATAQALQLHDERQRRGAGELALIKGAIADGELTIHEDH